MIILSGYFSINFSKYIPSLNEVINIIHKNGGILFLAHPYVYKLENTEYFLDRLYDEYSDIDGIECYYYDFTKEQIDYIKSFAEKRNLMISGGSDFHGKTIKPDIELGTGKDNNIRIKKLSLLDKLHK